MKILSANQIREADAYTIEHEPISSVDLMERAAGCCASWIMEHYAKKTSVKVVAGLGNNGGDGLVIARILASEGYLVEVFIIRHSNKCSADFTVNEERLRKNKHVGIQEIADTGDFRDDSFGKDDLVIDAMFGSGLSRKLEGVIAEVVDRINRSESTVVAIDIPSGLFMEDNSENDTKAIIQARVTLTFETPKLAFLFPENAPFVGDFHVLDIGLDKTFIERQSTPYNFITRDEVRSLLKPRSKFAHKGNYGHALLIAGSYGKMGAAVLAAKACLRAGAGLLTTRIPRCGYAVMQTVVPEAMVDADVDESYWSSQVKLDPYNAVGVGPGLGQEKQTQNMLKLLIQNTPVPLVMDADAINIIGENKTWISFLPHNSILTPHPKEFERLAGKSSDSYERLQMQRQFAIKHGLFVVLKGAHTAIACPDGTVYFNSTGNPGMATGGSGDVLTGMITGMMAQGYSSVEASIISIFLHGIAGDIVATTMGREALIARDIVDAIGEAYHQLSRSSDK